MPRTVDLDTLTAAVARRDRRAIARSISLVERADDGGALLAGLFPSTGRAHVIGITGAPGAGKSTLTDRLITFLRGRDLPVAVVAVDPSSPYTGGAILGDRIRMQDHALDDGVYIRSMASRGHLGGIATATPRALVVLDAAGYPVIIVETVGVGQAEVEIAQEADTTLVVVNPGWGDTIQAAKAGLLEAGDIFVVNKADRPGVEATVRDLRQMVELGGERPWLPPVATTVAAAGEGTAELWSEIERHRDHLAGGELDRSRAGRLERQLRAAVASGVERRAGLHSEDPSYRSAVASVVARRVDPWTAADRLLDGESPTT